MEPQMVGQLLQQVLQPATAQQATKQVKELMKDPNSIIPLTQQMAQNADLGVRQLAAVLLRRRLAKAWGSLSAGSKTEMKQILLNRLVEDPAHLVRLSIAHVVSSLGKLILMEWKAELFPFLQKCSESEQESHREVAQVVFSSILDAVAESLSPMYDDFATIFFKGLRDPTSSAVRVAAMKGVAALSCAAESREDFARLRQLVPAMIDVTRAACAEGKEDVVVFALEVLDDLAESADALKAEDLPVMVRFMLVIAENNDLSIGVREQALNFIHSIAKQKPKVITKSNLVPEILKVIIPMALSPDPEDHDEDEPTAHRIATQCVDSLSLNLPSRFIFEPIIKCLAPMINSSNPNEKRGALTLIGIMSEGCEDVMRGKLDELLPPILQAFSDSHPLVKSAASLSLGQMAEYLQPEITQYHQMTMSVLLNAMQDPATNENEAVQEKLCYAVELFCEHLEEFEIEAHLSQLMPALLHGLTVARGNRARENCIGAIGSAAQAAKTKFIPYVAQVFAILTEAMGQTREELIGLRSRATVCAGSVIQALPKQATSAYQARPVELVFEGLESIDHYELRESSYRFLGCLATSLKDDLAPLLSKAIPYAVASLLNSDGIVEQYEEDEDPLGGVDSEEDEEDERRVEEYHIRTGFIDEQEAALDFLCCLFRNISGTHMAPWLKNSLECVGQLHKYFHSGVRQSVANLVQSMVINVHHTFLPVWAPRSAQEDSPTNFSTENGNVVSSGNRGWTPGLPCRTPLHEHTIQLWVEKMWPILCVMLKEDEDKEVVGDVCTAIGELLELLGPHILEGTTVLGHDVNVTLIDTAVQIFSREHPCQKFDEDEIDDDEDSRVVEEYLFEGVSSLISGLAQTMGAQFDVPFAKLHKKMLRLATHKNSAAYRCIGIGCYADIFRTMGAVATPFVEPVIASALDGVRQKSDSSLRRNSAYCLGTIAEFASSLPSVQSQLLEMLKSLHALFSASPEGMREADLCVRDNAIAAVGRMLRGCTAAQIPHADVIPVFLQALPLKADFEESEGVLKTLLRLYFGGCDKEIIANNQANFLKAIVGELVNGSVNSSLTPETKEQAKSVLVAAVQSCGVDSPDIAAIAAVDSRYKELLTKLLR